MKISGLMEEGRTIFKTIFQRCITTKRGNCSEQDTLTKFIHPMLAALGWDILDFRDVQEEVFVKTDGKENHIDIVLRSSNNPYIGMEVKSLSFGKILDGSERNIKENKMYLVKDLQRKSERLDVKYAVLTRFAETIIFYPKTMDKIAVFSSPRAHFERFHILWKFLSKSATQVH